uniref:SGNH hydrolase-type esterase domain-containing protein n=1 Tax=Gadus morhua TaxID=8049 RepID=A0A8C5AGP4_GADMO
MVSNSKKYVLISVQTHENKNPSVFVTLQISQQDGRRPPVSLCPADHPGPPSQQTPAPGFSPARWTPPSAPLQGASGTTATTHCIPVPKIPVIQPLFPPSTLIIGDSITRHLRFFNLRDMLPTLPSTIRRIICDKSVFVSGPIPTIGRGNERFSRLLSLNTWLRDTCGETNVCFIENFDVFWNRQSLYLRDGLHPNTKGSRLLAANIHYTMTCIDTSRCSRHAQK